MRKNAKKVIEAFLLHKPAVGDAKKTISTDGNVIYSYAMAIAKRLADNTVRLVPYLEGPTRTTRSQIRACEIMLPSHFNIVIRESMPKESVVQEPQEFEIGDLVRVKDGYFSAGVSLTETWTLFDAQDVRLSIPKLKFKDQIGEIYLRPNGARATWWPTLNGYNYFYTFGLIIVHKKSKG